MSVSSTSSMPTIDYLGCKVTDLPALTQAPYFEVEKVETGALLFLRANLQLGSNAKEYPHLNILKGRLKPHFRDNTIIWSQMVCLMEAHRQKQLHVMGLPSDLPCEVNEEGKWIIREKVARYSASELGPSQISEQHIQDVAGYFYNEIVFGINLLGLDTNYIESSVFGPDGELLWDDTAPKQHWWAKHRFQVIGAHIQVGLPLGSLEFIQGSIDIRHETLLRQLKKIFPETLFRDVPLSIAAANKKKVVMGLVSSEIEGSSAIFALYEEVQNRNPYTFFSVCMELYRNSYGELKLENIESMDLLTEMLKDLFVIELRKKARFQNITSQECIRLVLDELKLKLNEAFTESFKSRVFRDPYHYFFALFLEKNSSFFSFIRERIYLLRTERSKLLLTGTYSDEEMLKIYNKMDDIFEEAMLSDYVENS